MALLHTPLQWECVNVTVQFHRLSELYENNVCDFKIAARPPPTPFWLFPPPNIQFLLNEANSSTIPEDILSRFNELKVNHSSYAFYYIDGSKSEDSVASSSPLVLLVLFVVQPRTFFDYPLLPPYSRLNYMQYCKL